MKNDRRRFLAASAALAAGEFTRNSIAAEPRDGHKPMTQTEMDALTASMFKDTNRNRGHRHLGHQNAVPLTSRSAEQMRRYRAGGAAAGTVDSGSGQLP